MFKILTPILDRIADAFRMPTEEARELHHQLANYEAQARQLRAFSKRSSDPLPIGDREAMSLYAGGVHYEQQLSQCRAVVNVYDNTGPEELCVFRAYGTSAAQAERRAAQLVSALDGARRL